MSKTLLLIDLPNIFHRGFHTHRHLSWRGIPTGGAYGLLQSLASLINKFTPTAVALCDDTKPYLRATYYPEYKAKRKKPDKEKDERFSLNFAIAFQAIEHIGVPLFKYTGAEADDIMGALAKNHENDYDLIVLVSADSDLLQLLDQQNLRILRGTGGKQKIWGKAEFVAAYPILKCCKDWLHINALSGGHNGLPGVRLIGEQKALMWYRDTQVDGQRGTKLDLKVQEHAEMLSASHFLAEIPFPGIANWQAVRMPVSHHSRYNSRELVQYLSRYGIKLNVHMSRAFEMFA